MSRRVSSGLGWAHSAQQKTGSQCQHFILNMGVSCWSLLQGLLTLDPFQISCRWKVTCVIGEPLPSDRLSLSITFDLRRYLARKHLKPNEVPITFTSFPRLGVLGQFTEPYFDPADAVSSHSLFLPEEITNPHARFPFV